MPTSHDPPTSHETTLGPQQWGLWLAIAVALALRVFRLGHQSLWTDEIFTWLTSYPHDPLPFTELLDDMHGPGVSFLLHGWMRVFGQSEWALRLPMALASAALVPVVAAIARAAAGPRAFLPAAWLAAVSPFFVWYGQESRNYAFAMLFGAIQVWAVLRYHDEARTRHLVALALAATLGALSNFNTFLLFPALLALLVVAPPAGERGRGLARWLLPAAAGLAVAVALSPWLLTHFGILEFGRLVPGRVEPPSESPLRGATTFSPFAIPYTIYAYSVGFTLGPGLRELREHAAWNVLAPHLPVVAAAALSN
jgi:4-amino-4-deoxy-L-arabinose transferase-like glycosyltransferase